MTSCRLTTDGTVIAVVFAKRTRDEGEKINK